MNILNKLRKRQATLKPKPALADDAVAGFGTPAGIGTMGGAKDVEKTLRTHTGKVPQEFVTPVQVIMESPAMMAVTPSFSSAMAPL